MRAFFCTEDMAGLRSASSLQRWAAEDAGVAFWVVFSAIPSVVCPYSSAFCSARQPGQGHRSESMSLKDAVSALRSLKAELEASRAAKAELENAYRGVLEVRYVSNLLISSAQLD